ncbi:protein kinase [Achlya hypogyna]|uniref:Protein kinase n=1 Tax=Achlya hypogyna TaxID=1202772 RepID=A0A1V9Z6G1_ACHHY|nr:protein kinase [Achlya hypogyna]
MFGAWMALGVLLQVPVQGATCPNTTTAAPRTLVAGVACGTAKLCYLDASCAKVSAVEVPANSKIYNVPRVGDISAYEGSRLFIHDSPDLTFDSTLAFPPYLFEMGMENCSLQAVPPIPDYFKFSELYFRHNKLTSIPEITTAARLSEFWADDNLLTDASKVPIPTRALVLENNRISRLSDLVYDTSRLYFAGNPLTTITNVNFTDRVTIFNFSGCHLTTFTLTPSSYAVLNALSPAKFALGSTQLNGTACAGMGGELAPLQERFEACVLTGPTVAAVAQRSSAALWIILAVVLVVATAAVAVSLVRRCQTPKPATDDRRPTLTITFPTFDSNRTTDMEAHDDVLRDKLNALALFRVEITDVVAGAFVAEGGYGAVFEGTYQHQPVALKTLSPLKMSAAAVGRFLDEILLLSTLECAHIVRLVGVAWTRPSDVLCLLEWMDGGDLRARLLAPTPFPWPAKRSCVANLADALVYVHSLHVLHRDVKSRNLLAVTTDDGATLWKLADFGIAREDLDATMTCGVGTSRWTAPEVLKGEHYASPADIYSLGVVLSELDTHALPYADAVGPSGQPLSDATLVHKVCSGEIAPSFTAACPAWVRQLAADCLQHDPELRPTAMQVAHRLAQLARTPLIAG